MSTDPHIMQNKKLKNKQSKIKQIKNEIKENAKPSDKGRDLTGLYLFIIIYFLFIICGIPM